MDPKTQPADGEDTAENSSAAAEAIARDFDESIHLESPHSIGVDIVEIERMRAILERTPRCVAEPGRARHAYDARPRAIEVGREQIPCLFERHLIHVTICGIFHTVPCGRLAFHV